MSKSRKKNEKKAWAHLVRPALCPSLSRVVFRPSSWCRSCPGHVAPCPGCVMSHCGRPRPWLCRLDVSWMKGGGGLQREVGAAAST